MLLYKQKKNQGPKGKRILISINVLGSAGPIRFVVNEEELVAAVIHTALKSYAREGRLPVLGSDFNDFLLYCPYVGQDALSPWETIGSLGARKFHAMQEAKACEGGRL
ncbi:Senescence-associated protein [Quillaja saponaria]|uniref:Senescence-associated protein n=1 Tax=Quillaja saponaria TaxID=32244 RepID=A0AAD7PGQ4_QUISA|nr:Senescence-associated protein [Quillaja saponaria]